VSREGGMFALGQRRRDAGQSIGTTNGPFDLKPEKQDLPEGLSLDHGDLRHGGARRAMPDRRFLC
jgi:hypothetical protein